MRIVDADGHVVEPPDLWDRHAPARFRAAAPRVVVDDEGHLRYRLEGRLTPRLPFMDAAGERPRFVPPAGGSDPRARLADLDAEGIAAAVLYPSTGLLLGGVEDPPTAVALCRAYDDWLAEYCAADARRLFGAAAVPLQDPAAAAEEAVRLGFRAVFVRPNPFQGRTLGDPVYDRLWATCAEAGVAVAVHEGTTLHVPTAGADRFPDFFSLHAVSHALEQQLALVALVTGGVLERHPRLRVVFLESGAAWVPYWLERLDAHFEKWGWMLPSLRTRPSELFRRQCWVSCDGDEATLPATADFLGADRLVWASDYPHPDAIFPGAPRALLARDDVAGDVKERIFVRNAAALYGLEEP
jgi:predicted TIM-barrel fold metal-dependent hydrolase